MHLGVSCIVLFRPNLIYQIDSEQSIVIFSINQVCCFIIAQGAETLQRYLDSIYKIKLRSPLFNTAFHVIRNYVCKWWLPKYRPCSEITSLYMRCNKVSAIPGENKLRRSRISFTARKTVSINIKKSISSGDSLKLIFGIFIIPSEILS